MSAISSVGSQPMQIQPAPAAKPVDRDGDHDSDAPRSGAAQASSATQRALNVLA